MATAEITKIWRNPRYEMVDLLGKGDGGTVFLAEDYFDVERVVIKQGKVIDEAMMLAVCEHPWIPCFLELFYEKPHWYMVEEYVHGVTLHEYRQLLGGIAPFKVICSIGMQLASILHYLHTHQIIHRDIKPRNILISLEEHHVTLIDLERAVHVSAPNDFIGPGKYAAPECGSQQSLTNAVDIYGLGAVLHELMFDTPVCVPYNVLTESPSRRLHDLLAACLYKDPTKRPTACAVGRVLMELYGAF